MRERLHRGQRPRRVADDVEARRRARLLRARSTAAKRPSIASQFARPIGLTCESWRRQRLALAKPIASAIAWSKSSEMPRVWTANSPSSAVAMRASSSSSDGPRTGRGSTRARRRARPRRRAFPPGAASPSAASSPGVAGRCGVADARSRGACCDRRTWPRSAACRAARSRAGTRRASASSSPELAETRPTTGIRSIAPRRKTSPSGAGEIPQLPATAVVIPCMRFGARRAGAVLERHDPVDVRVDVDEPRRRDEARRVDDGAAPLGCRRRRRCGRSR